MNGRFVLRNEYGFYWAGGSWTAIRKDAKQLTTWSLGRERYLHPILGNVDDYEKIPVLTEKQIRTLVSAYTCLKATPFSSVHDPNMRALEAKGLAKSQLGSSINGGREARRYTLTKLGVELGERYHAARREKKEQVVGT